MASSEADICNLALARVGQKQFISALTDNTTPGQLCAVLYPAARDTVLGSFPWPFAAKHATLAALTPAAGTAYVTARGGWQNAYTLPSDFLAARYIFTGVRPGGSLATSASAVGQDYSSWNAPPVLNVGVGGKAPFEIEVGDDNTTLLLLSDWQTPELVYTAKVTAVPLFHPLFADALGWKLASDLALALPVKATVGDAMEKKYQVAMLKAAAAVLRGEQEDPQPDSEIIAARG